MDTAIRIKSDDILYFNWRGNALTRLARYQEAIDSYDKAIQVKPDEAYLWSNRGWTLRKQKRYQEAFDSCEKAVRLKADNLPYQYDKAQLLIDLKRYQEALTILNEIINKNASESQLIVDPSDLGEVRGSRVRISRVWHLKGIALMELDKNQEALAQFDKAISLNAYSFISKINFELVKLDEDLGIHDSWYGKGAALAKLGKYPDALAAFSKAIELKPDFADAITARDIVRKRI